MEDDEMTDSNDFMTDLLANSLEGNALGVKDAVNAMMNARALDALQSMKVDVAQSVYGNYASDDEGGEEAVEDESEADIEDMDIPQDDDEFIDSNADDLFAELDQLADSEEEDFEQDEDDTND